MTHELWRIELFGGLRARAADQEITRFRTRKTASLLAYLAHYREQPHPREKLIDMLWPESCPEAGQASLRTALASLRCQLEPPGTPAGTVILADRSSVQLRPDAVTTDIAEFQAALRSAARTSRAEGKPRGIRDALDLYRGEFLPGFYEDWALNEQRRLADVYFRALHAWIVHLEEAGDLACAIEYAHRGVAMDPLREEAHADLIRLYAASGEVQAALRQYRELERILDRELQAVPSGDTRALIRRIRRDGAPVETRGQADESTAGKEASSVDKPTCPPRRPFSSSAGTITLLAAEIWAFTPGPRHAPALEEARVALDALMRREAKGYGGTPLGQAQGALILAFSRACDAVECAAACQRAVTTIASPAETGSPQVSMVVHTGDMARGLPGAEGPDRGDPRGMDPVLETTDRMLRAAHARQVLCSEATALIARQCPETSLPLEDLGAWRLRGCASPQRLFQVRYPGMPEFPPPRTDGAHATRLPLQITRFFGRESEMADLRDLVVAGGARLVTLTGPGGSGKTRLALEAAAELADALPATVLFVPLAQAEPPPAPPRLGEGGKPGAEPPPAPPKLGGCGGGQSGTRVLRAILDACGAGLSPGADPLEQAVTLLSDRPTMLLLDNFEQVAVRGAPLVLQLLARVPGLTCLVTSRKRLGVPGERVLPVAPLPTPGLDDSPEQLWDCPSVRLFLDRAQAVRPDIQVTPASAPGIAALCRRLDGIPLALELVATYAWALTPAQMLARLHERIDWPSRRARSFPARHRTMRASMNWSHQLLPRDLRRFFARLSVFRGACMPAAAAWVCLGEEAEAEALERLGQLQAHSLILPEERGGEIGFRMLETIREYARERLEEDDDAEAVRRRHAGFCLSLAEEAQRPGPQPAAALERLSAAQDDLHAALEWSGKHDPPLHSRLAAALSTFGHMRGLVDEESPRSAQG